MRTDSTDRQSKQKNTDKNYLSQQYQRIEFFLEYFSAIIDI